MQTILKVAEEVQGTRLPEPRKIPHLVATLTILFWTESLNLRTNSHEEPLLTTVNALEWKNSMISWILKLSWRHRVGFSFIPPFTSCLISGKFPNSLEPRFLHLSNGTVLPSLQKKVPSTLAKMLFECSCQTLHIYRTIGILEKKSFLLV